MRTLGLGIEVEVVSSLILGKALLSLVLEDVGEVRNSTPYGSTGTTTDNFVRLSG